MSHFRLSLVTFGLCTGLSLLAGCSDEPNAPPRFQINPENAAQEAMKLYDKNQDGKIDATELEASPPLRDLLHNLKSHDSSHPDSLTAADIAGRLHAWIESPSTLLTMPVGVYLDDKPLPDANVEFEPEPFLGASYKAHHGTTNDAGIAALDPELSGYPGIYVGLYRVRISKKAGSVETVPEKYNTRTVLGIELATDVPHPSRLGAFRLTSR